MSRIGRQPIPIPPGVEVTLDGDRITVKGPKGVLSRTLPPEMTVERQDGVLLVKRPSDEKRHKALHGLTRTLIANMIEGVTRGYEKTLEIYGVGYRAQKQGNNLILTLGFSHPVEVIPPKGIEFTNIETFSPTQANDWLSCRFVVRGIDKELVGQVAAEIRALREPDPYKGKGIRYAGERILRKAGKAGKTGARSKAGK
mgnify:CR=1 FL=1|jgi:large subunit ribosomal protein L6